MAVAVPVAVIVAAAGARGGGIVYVVVVTVVFPPPAVGTVVTDVPGIAVADAIGIWLPLKLSLLMVLSSGGAVAATTGIFSSAGGWVEPMHTYMT